MVPIYPSPSSKNTPYFSLRDFPNFRETENPRIVKIAKEMLTEAAAFGNKLMISIKNIKSPTPSSIKALNLKGFLAKADPRVVKVSLAIVAVLVMVKAYSFVVDKFFNKDTAQRDSI